MTTRTLGAVTARRLLRLLPACVLGLALACAVGRGAPALAASPTAHTTTASCPSYNPPNELVLGGGTPQSATLGSPFATNLSVGVEASNGCPITAPLAGIAVTFTAPASGPSGLFSASGSNAVLVGTNAAGQATAPTFTANSLPGGYLVVASSEIGSVSFSLVNTASGVPAKLLPVSPARESVVVFNRYANPLKVRVVDATGAPVPGAPVTFEIGSGGTGAGGGGGGGAADTGSPGAAFLGGSSQTTEATDADGVATSPPLLANATAGRFTATATVAGSNAVATFSLTNLAARPPRITLIGGSHESATVDHTYLRPLRVKIRTAQGAPLQGAAVTFTLAAGSGGGGGASGSSGAGASFVGGSTEVTSTTDAKGIATSPLLTANTVTGTFKATATTTGATKAAIFTLANRSATPATITAGAASGHAIPVGAKLLIPLAVTVADRNGNPVPGIVVAFAAPARGPSGRFEDGRRIVRVKTAGDGVAVAPRFTANAIAGGYIVTATVRDSGTRDAAFALLNVAGVPA